MEYRDKSWRDKAGEYKAQRDAIGAAGLLAILVVAVGVWWSTSRDADELRGSLAFQQQQNAQLQYQLDELDAGLSRAQAAERKALWMVGQFSEAVRNTHKLAPGDAFEQIDALTGQAADMVRTASARLVASSFEQHEIDMGKE